MEGILQTTGKVKSTVTIIAIAKGWYDKLIPRYLYWLFYALSLFSCQHQLTQHESAEDASTKSEVEVVSASRSIAIDTSVVSLEKCILHSENSQKILQFYSFNHFQTRWLEVGTPGDLCYELIYQLAQASQYGLNSEDYHTIALARNLKDVYEADSIDINKVIALDVKLTDAYFQFTKHLRYGRLSENVGAGKYIWVRQQIAKDSNDVKYLLKATSIAELQQALNTLQPANEQYQKLKSMLSTYLKLENNQVTIHVGKDIAPGERDTSIPAIRRKLALTDLSNDEIAVKDSLLYDDALVAAVKVFQQRYGLSADGVINSKVIKYLNQSFKEKAQRIALNMERLRWLPANLGEQYIAVNIPEFTLRIFEKTQQTMEMKVVIGAVNSPTPVFHDSLEYMVFSPTWTVPPSIIKHEILPRLKKTPSYYNNRNYTFYKNGVEINPETEPWDSVININQYRVVQQPGSSNSLGLVKFAMPNAMNIYLHDTPDHTPFSQNYRALSHGCVRLDDPRKLASYLTVDQPDWTDAAIGKAMTSTNPIKATIKKLYDVHLLYQTVWVDANGFLNFREDIYGHDKRQLQMLHYINNTMGNASLAKL